MKAKLRGHHLICLNFFRGEGYSEDFIRNIYSVIAKEMIEIVNGPDDVCIMCPYLKDEMCNNPEYSDEMILLQDREALRLLGFKPGMGVDWRPGRHIGHGPCSHGSVNCNGITSSFLLLNRWRHSGAFLLDPGHRDGRRHSTGYSYAL